MTSTAARLDRPAVHLFDRVSHRWGWLLRASAYRFYAIRQTDHPDGLIKLGRAIDPEKRVRHILMPNLEIYLSVPEWVTSEREAHRQWKALRREGEWFEQTPELVGWLDGLRHVELDWTSFRQRLLALQKVSHRSLRHLATVEAEMATATRVVERCWERIERSRHTKLRLW